MIRFYIAFYIAKIVTIILKCLRHNATQVPGRIALTICPDFLKYIAKPNTIITVTGTNGKTTVSNLIQEILQENGKKVISNKLGSNINSGIASCFLSTSTFLNKNHNEIAVIEMDERSSLKVLPYLKPTYLVCTNLFRDSIRRNAHPEFIFNIINSALPAETKLILNADDLISSNLGKNNTKIYFGINKLDTDLKESINIINDARICPKCGTKLKYNYVRYHHIGNAHCPRCGYKSPEADYKITNIDYEKNLITIEHKNEITKYNMISDSIFNIYNMLAGITMLQEMGIKSEQLQENFKNYKIVESRFQKKNINGINVIKHLAKGQNPIACSCVFDYIKKEIGNKEIILLIYDYFDAKESSENVTWLYDCDFEFLNTKNVDKIIIGGPRSQDFYLRLLIAGVSKDKLVCTENPENTADLVSLSRKDDIYVLYDVYTEKIANNVCSKIESRINSEEDMESSKQAV